MPSVSRSPFSPWSLTLAAVVLLVFIADQASKYAISKLTPVGSQHMVIPGVLNVVHTGNPGVAFGLLADSESPLRAPLLIIFSVAVICLIGWLLFSGRAGGRLGELGMAFILGGAAGNVLDRILRHSVTDFIDFYLGSHHWYTFNLADSAIVLGAGLIMLELLRDMGRAAQERA